MAKIRALMLRYTRVDATTIHVAQFDCQLETARRICFTFIFLFQFPFSLSFYFFVVWKRLKIRAAGQHMFGSLTVTRTHMPFAKQRLLRDFCCWLLLVALIWKLTLQKSLSTHTYANTCDSQPTKRQERVSAPRFQTHAGFPRPPYTFAPFLLTAASLWCSDILLQPFIALFRLFVWQFEWHFNFSATFHFTDIFYVSAFSHFCLDSRLL